MTLFHESAIYRLWALLLASYEDSALRRLLDRAGDWCGRQIERSRVLRPLCREGAVAKAWPESLLCRLLSFLVDLPARLLRWIYRLLEGTLEDSFFARLAFTLGDETATVQFWLVALLWVIPFERWNNAYTMMAFAFLLLLFHAGAMHRSERRLDLKSIGFYPLLLFGAMFLAVAFSYTRSQSVRFIFYHISAALCVLVTVSAVRHAEDLKRLAAGGAVCVLGSSLYGILQRLQGLEVNISYVDAKLNEDMPSRVFSFFDNPNTFAEVLILLLPLVLALVLCARRPVSRLRHGRDGLPLEAQAAAPVRRGLLSGGAAAAVLRAEPHPDHYQSGGHHHLQPLPSVRSRPAGDPPLAPGGRGPGHRRRPELHQSLSSLLRHVAFCPRP